MVTKEFISYLNSLHNYNAQNENAYAENNIDNKFYQEVMVEMKICDYIKKELCSSDPRVLVLTGQAGDGKTSIMVQVLKSFDFVLNATKREETITLPDGRECVCIKDFSELSDDEKTKVLSRVVELPQQGKFAFIVANTGPLITTFTSLFNDHDERVQAEIDLINCIDENDGKVRTISSKGYKLQTINIAELDNTYFAKEFLNKIISNHLWADCENCKSHNYCIICKNRNLILKNKTKTEDFIDKYYIWLASHGKRLTIRSITEHISYMITGGFDCQTVRPQNAYAYLYPNLFFGYVGLNEDINANNITGIRAGKNYHFDSKRLRSDEDLLINKDYEHIFSNEEAETVKNAAMANFDVDGSNEMLRRFYFFMNNKVGDAELRDIEDIFSKHFWEYFKVTRKHGYPDASDKPLVLNALSMIYDGVIKDNNIPITLSRETGITQNVQLVVDIIDKTNMRIDTDNISGHIFDPEHSPRIMYIKLNGKRLDVELTLPLMDYFEELKNGIIDTDIDPQLSQGIEKLKSEISSVINQNDDPDCLKIAISKSSGLDVKTLEFHNDKVDCG